MNLELIRAVQQLEEEKGISKDVIFEDVEAALLTAYKKNFGGAAQNVRIEVDRGSGEYHVYQIRTVVEAVDDPTAQIALGEVQQYDPTAAVGDMVELEVTPRDFGRIAAQTAKQVLVQRLREAERELVYKEFRDREGDIVTGQVQRIERKNVYLDLGRIEAVLPPPEQIPRESHRQGERVKAYVVEVRQGTRGPQIVVSRTHPGLLKRLFELEVPEIYEGIVEIKTIAREAGARSKIAVASRDKNVDAVGACVGPKGSRVQAIVDELRGEKIDIIPWNPDAALFVAAGLSPAKVVRVDVNEETKTATVIVPDHQLSLAIGREGQNARLAAKLTGWRIDIKSETQLKELEAQKLFVDLPPESGGVTAAGEAASEAAGEGPPESIPAPGEVVGEGAPAAQEPAAEGEAVPAETEAVVAAGSGESEAVATVLAAAEQVEETTGEAPEASADETREEVSEGAAG